MGNTVSGSLFGASAAVGLAFLSAGCGNGNRESPAFTSADLAKGTVASALSLTTPSVSKIPGGNNLLAITQVNSQPLFFRTFSGYATREIEAGVDVFRIISGGMASGTVGGNITFVQNTPYMQVTALEVISHYRGGLEPLMQTIEEDYSRSTKSVDPAVVKHALEILVKPPIVEDASGNIYVGWHAFRKSGVDLKTCKINGVPFPESTFIADQQRLLNETTSFGQRTPLIISIGDGQTLRIDEFPYQDQSTFVMNRTSSGYVSTGAHASLVIAEIGGKTPRANIYLTTAPSEAKALVEGGWPEIVRIAYAQEDVIFNSLSSLNLSNAYTGRIPFSSPAAIAAAQQEAKKREEAVINAIMTTLEAQSIMNAIGTPQQGMPGSF